MERLLQAKEQATLAELEGLPPIEVLQEMELRRWRCARFNVMTPMSLSSTLDRRLLGVIPIGRLLALLHEEHVDNFLRMGGVSRMDHLHLSLTAQQTLTQVRARLPG